MTRFRDLPIRRKLAALTLAASGSAVLLSTAAFVSYDRAGFKQTLAQKLAGEAEIVAFNTASAIVFHDPDSAAFTLAALQSDRHVVSAAIYTPDGKLFARYLRPGLAGVVPAALLEGETRDPGYAFEGERLVLRRPIVMDRQSVGTLVINADLEELSERLVRVALIAGAVSLAALLVALLVGWFGRRTISEPILELAEASRRISEKSDFSERPAVRGHDEVGALVTAFNHMLDALARRDSELRETHAELERRVAESTELYKKAEEANRLKDQFLTTLSHELRTPLNAIVGWAHLLRAGLDPKTFERAIETISRNAMQQSKLIGDILDIQRIAAGKLRLNLQSVSLPPVIAAAIETVRPAAQAKEIELQTLMDPDAGPVLADPDRLQQVFWNLLSNAVKFIPRKGRVRVSLTRINSHVEVAVEDNGPGLEPRFVPYVFDRFRQADASSTRPHGGLGLGLAIVRDFVELHGGSVAAANRSAGSGAIFTVKLPRMSVSPAAGQSAESVRRSPMAEHELPLEAAPDLHGVKVLVVDDEADARELISVLLTRCGARVVTVASAADGLASMKRERPDVLLSDIEMPGEDGYAFLKKVRSLSAKDGGQTPAAALTAYAGAEDRVRALAVGFQIHVPKPVQPTELAAVVASLASRSTTR